MPPPRFLASNPAVRATTTAVSLIWQSKIMTVAIFCEAIAAIAAVLNWVTDFWWLANAALTLATFGAVAVACRVAWDYHGRGLNAQQTHHVDGILTGASLNQTQSNEIAEAIQSSELTPRQKSDLPAALRAIDVAIIVEAQKAVDVALDYLRRPDHGHVVVIHRMGGRRLDVRYVYRPRARGLCQRQHPYEQGADLNLVEVATSLFQPFTNPAVLWKHPVNGNVCHTNYDARGAHGHELIFSFEDCVPKWRVPTVGDYVLKHNAKSGSTWEQKP